MTKMKLCPIEPTDEMIVKGIAAIVTCDSVSLAYEAMTAECQTVEVVDGEEIKSNMVNFFIDRFGFHDPPNDRQALVMLCCDMWVHHLYKKGYKIVRCCDE